MFCKLTVIIRSPNRVFGDQFPVRRASRRHEFGLADAAGSGSTVREPAGKDRAENLGSKE
jgi:hypothetical protein